MGFGLDSDAIHSPDEHYGLFNYLKELKQSLTFSKRLQKNEMRNFSFSLVLLFLCSCSPLLMPEIESFDSVSGFEINDKKVSITVNTRVNNPNKKRVSIEN